MKNQTHVTGPFALTQLAAAAATLALAIISTNAHSLGLGRLSVQSALGETLKAEIDITSLSAEEAGTLKVRIAPPESYRATGVEYNSVLTGTQVQVTRRDGRTVLRVSSDRAVQEPFVDVILELTWASGRLVREYTLLFDPPTAPKPVAAPPVVATAPVLMAPAPALTEAVPAAPPTVATALPSRPAIAPAPAFMRPRAEAAAPRPSPAPAPVAAAPLAPRPATQYAVKPGDTLSRIASKTQAPGVSLDQMLVGLYRSNPDAFIDRNMNLLKAGSVLQVPASDALTEVTPGEAKKVIQAQSADFSAYRQRLAGVAPTLKQEESERQSKGRVQAAVEDRKPAAAATPDKLTLSKAASAVAEANASEEARKKDAAARVAELTRNVEALKQLSTAAKPAAALAPAAIVAPEPVASAVATPPPVVAVIAPKPEAIPASAATLPPTPPVQRAEPSLLDQLTENPLLPLGALLLIVAGAFGFYRLRKRQGDKQADTGFIESRLQPDSFFGASGGSRVDTRDAGSGGSSMTYSLSQLDAIGDVDPVAEADVYLAYGRDLQAEEILKEALRANPGRLAIRLKLLEVYAKRRDTKGFEQLAIQLYAETHGVGEDWGKAQEMGRQIDPDNPLYHDGGAPARSETGQDIHPEPMDASTMPHTINAGAPPLAVDAFSRSGPDTGPMSGFDLDLDLDLAAPGHAASMAATQALPATIEQAPLEMDFDLSRPPPAEVTSPLLSFDLDSPAEYGTVTPTQPGSDNALDFDLSDIDLSLPSTATGIAPEPIPFAPDSAADQLAHALEELADDDGDPLMRQLELADEFRQIGDTEGAREVLQELIAKASGPLRDKAQAMLNELR